MGLEGRRDKGEGGRSGEGAVKVTHAYGKGMRGGCGGRCGRGVEAVVEEGGLMSACELGGAVGFIVFLGGGRG